MIHDHPKRCPLNVPGPFYTLGDCLACEIPECEAPELLAPLKDGNYITYFVRQPETEQEIENACRAILVCCVEDLRYGGTDKSIILRLGNTPHASDYIVQDDQLVLCEKPNHMTKTATSSRATKPWWKFW
jgi:hypothetical protein